MSRHRNFRHRRSRCLSALNRRFAVECEPHPTHPLGFRIPHFETDRPRLFRVRRIPESHRNVCHCSNKIPLTTASKGQIRALDGVLSPRRIAIGPRQASELRSDQARSVQPKLLCPGLVSTETGDKTSMIPPAPGSTREPPQRPCRQGECREPGVRWRSRRGTVIDDLLVEKVGGVKGRLEVGAILIFAYLLHVNPGAIWENLDRLPGRTCT